MSRVTQCSLAQCIVTCTFIRSDLNVAYFWRRANIVGTNFLYYIILHYFCIMYVPLKLEILFLLFNLPTVIKLCDYARSGWVPKWELNIMALLQQVFDMFHCPFLSPSQHCQNTNTIWKVLVYTNNILKCSCIPNNVLLLLLTIVQ